MNITHEAFKKQNKKWFNNRQKGIASVFYQGDKVAFQSANALNNNIDIFFGEVSKSDWAGNKVHSRNGMVYVRQTHEVFGENFQWFGANQLLLIN